MGHPGSPVGGAAKVDPDPAERSPEVHLLTGAELLGTWSVRRASDPADIRHATADIVSSSQRGRVAAPAGPPPGTRLGDPVGRLVLVVSELATNALKYGSGQATVTVSEVTGGGWLVDAYDANVRDYPRPHRADPGRSGQNGLLLVITLSRTWGWYVDSWTRRKHVWAHVENDPDDG